MAILHNFTIVQVMDSATKPIAIFPKIVVPRTKRVNFLRYANEHYERIMNPPFEMLSAVTHMAGHAARPLAGHNTALAGTTLAGHIAGPLQMQVLEQSGAGGWCGSRCRRLVLEQE